MLSRKHNSGWQPKPRLSVAAACSFSEWEATRVASRSRTRPGRSRPPARAAGIPAVVSAACSQAASRAVALAERRRASAAESMPASRRQAVGVEATGPKPSAWSRSRARSAVTSPPSASMIVRSTAIRPGSCPVPRGRSGRSASVKALVRLVTWEKSANKRDPAWLTTSWPSPWRAYGRTERPSADTTSLGRDWGGCTQKVPSCCDDSDLRQASSSQSRRQLSVFRSSFGHPHISETRRLVRTEGQSNARATTGS